MISIIKKHLKNLLVFSTGLVGLHLTSKLLDYNNTKAKNIIQKIETNNNLSLDLDTKNKVLEFSSEINNLINYLKTNLYKINKGDSANNFLSNYNNLYDYLDNLTIMQESAIYHMFVFISLILINFNILGIFFGNEIIKFFDLEKKFPSIYIFFKLRSKFNKYYLM